MRGNCLLLITALIWGTTFVAQMVGMEELGPFTYAAVRFPLGFIVVMAAWYAYQSSRNQQKQAGTYFSGWKAGICSGIFMFIASSMQQVAMQYTTAGKTAFITSLYIILVPLVAVFLKHKITAQNWVGAILALVGLYLLAIHGEFVLNYGDLLVFISTFFWTAQILWIDYKASQVDAIELSAAQVGVCSVGSMILAIMFEDIKIAPILNSWFPLVYGGVLSAGVAYTLQIIGQKYAEPSHAAVIMSFEAVFGAVASWIVLSEIMTGREITGCVLMLVGMLVTQVKHIPKMF